MATTDPDLKTSAGFHNNPIEMTISYKFSVGTFHDQVTAAIEGGSNHWARIDVGAHQLGWRNYFTAKFTEDNGQAYELSLDKLKAGIQVLATKYPHHFVDIVRETGDATTGDVLVQCALLGDIVYG